MAVFSRGQSQHDTLPSHHPLIWHVYVADTMQGLFTLLVGLLAFGLMPAGPCQTASWFRGKKGWFDERFVLSLKLKHNQYEL